MGTFFDEDPNRPAFSQGIDGPHQVLKIERIPVFPPRWGSTFADIGNNARSALDYLVYELAVEGGGNPEKDRTAFPISIDRDEYWAVDKRGVSYRDRALAGVDERWRLEIDDLQPYNRTQFPYGHPLALLNRLSNRQKHRKPHPACAMIETPAHYLSPDSRNEVRDVTVRYWGDDVDVEAGFIGNRPGRDSGLRIYKKPQRDNHVGVFVAFGEYRVGLEDMNDIIDFVGNIVLPRFEPAFEPASE
jgi:hypothetical protein